MTSAQDTYGNAWLPARLMPVSIHLVYTHRHKVEPQKPNTTGQHFLVVQAGLSAW